MKKSKGTIAEKDALSFRLGSFLASRSSSLKREGKKKKKSPVKPAFHDGTVVYLNCAVQRRLISLRSSLDLNMFVRLFRCVNEVFHVCRDCMGFPIAEVHAALLAGIASELLGCDEYIS